MYFETLATSRKCYLIESKYYKILQVAPIFQLNIVFALTQVREGGSGAVGGGKGEGGTHIKCPY